jgi:hypothetical protein
VSTPTGSEDERPEEEPPFDPYRFGKPDHPIPAEYAPPGYTGPVTPTAAPYGQPASYPQQPPYAGGPNPYPQQQPYPQYPQYPYGAPPPPQFHGYVQPRTGNGKAIAGMVLGIGSIVLCWLSFFDAVFVVSGLTLSILALNETKQRPDNGRGMAIAGLVCSIIGAVLATVLTLVVVHAANQCGGFSNDTSASWSQCVRSHL